LVCHIWASGPFCYDKHLLHLWICLLFPLVLTPFWALFFLVLQQDPNGEDQMQRHLLLARRRHLLSRFLLYSTIVYMNVMLCPFSAYRIWLLLLMMVICTLIRNFLWIDFLTHPSFR
jgi:hypothetical protein